MKVKLLSVTNKDRVEERIKVVATAGKLSRFPGTVTEVYDSCEDVAKNQRFIERVIGMGHESITDHDYLVFAIEDVSPIVEQILIEERFSSFTIKSRREVDFSNAGYYVPEFRDNNHQVLANNKELQKMYMEHMKLLFNSYSDLLELGIKKEDARFVLPYSFNSNIIMGIDAHVFKNLIVRLTKGKESNIAELRELGEKLYEIMEQYVPYLKNIIDKAEVPNKDLVGELLDDYIDNSTYEILGNVELLSASSDVDKQILLSALMRVYGFDYNKALAYYEKVLANDLELQKELMKKILVNGKDELKQVNFRFQVPISLAVLTHITRHRTHDLMVPDFVPVRDLTKYKTPASVSAKAKEKYDEIYRINQEMYEKFKNAGVCDEDLIYFYLAGNMLNIVTNMDGATLSHIARLRICTKAQWEIRGILTQMRELVKEVAPVYATILGPDCEVFRECHEGKESCGKIKVLKGEN